MQMFSSRFIKFTFILLMLFIVASNFVSRLIFILNGAMNTNGTKLSQDKPAEKIFSRRDLLGQATAGLAHKLIILTALI